MRPAKRASGAASARVITPIFPLLLLETLRDRDRPSEVLEAEDLTTSMPRRLGLSDVVFVQIRRFQEEVKRRRLQSAAEIEELIRLVVRRPDAAQIFAEAGRRVAHHLWKQRLAAFRRSVRWLPGPLAKQVAHRAGRRMFHRLRGTGRLILVRWPVELRIQRSLTAQADPSGAACSFYAGALGELLRLYTGRNYRVLHPQCETRGDQLCHWTVEITA